MEKTEIFRLSAKALDVHKELLPYWDPLINPWHRQNCVDWLLSQRRVLLIDPDNHHESWGLNRPREPMIKIDCLASEFPGMVAAEVQRMRDES